MVKDPGRGARLISKFLAFLEDARAQNFKLDCQDENV